MTDLTDLPETEGKVDNKHDNRGPEERSVK